MNKCDIDIPEYEKYQWAWMTQKVDVAGNGGTCLKDLGTQVPQAFRQEDHMNLKVEAQPMPYLPEEDFCLQSQVYCLRKHRQAV